VVVAGEIFHRHPVLGQRFQGGADDSWGGSRNAMYPTSVRSHSSAGCKVSRVGGICLIATATHAAGPSSFNVRGQLAHLRQRAFGDRSLTSVCCTCVAHRQDLLDRPFADQQVMLVCSATTTLMRLRVSRRDLVDWQIAVETASSRLPSTCSSTAT